MNYQEIDPLQASSLIEQRDDLLLLDVREEHEYLRVRIEGVKLLPLGELEQRYSELNPEQPILCICAGGVRSEKATRFLMSKEFKDVTNMAEGMRGWINRGLPTQGGT